MDKNEIKVDRNLLHKIYNKASEIYEKNKKRGVGFRESVEMAINEIGLPSKEWKVRQKYFGMCIWLREKKIEEERKVSNITGAEISEKYNRQQLFR